MQTALSDAMILAAGLQIVRTIGVKRRIPLLGHRRNRARLDGYAEAQHRRWRQLRVGERRG